jgi:hypothetical protein
VDDKAAVSEKSSPLIQSKDAGIPANAINSALYDLVSMLLYSKLYQVIVLQETNKECQEASSEGVHTGIVLGMP